MHKFVLNWPQRYRATFAPAEHVGGTGCHVPVCGHRVVATHGRSQYVSGRSINVPRVSPYDRRPVLPTSQACARVWSAQGRRKCSGLGGGGKGGETPTGPLPELTKIPPKEPRAARNALRKDREARGVWPSVLLSCIGRGMSGEFRPLFRMQRQIVKNRPVHVIRRVKIYDCTKFQASPIGHSRKIRYFVEMSVTPFI